MGKIVLITGGQRSGKSRFAQSSARQLSDHPVYLATARIWDEDFRQRVEHHRSDRDASWTTIEEPVHLSRVEVEGRVVVLDCITLWLTNLFYDHHFEVQPALETARKEWRLFSAREMTLFVVSNELGMGVHPVEESARHFADLQGWMNQDIASTADEVWLMVSGIPVRIK
jgi:adenosylcobinamide kinase/adenosylcobinamide-phosphate guanylyltransferase